MVIDLLVRGRTKGKASLDEVMRQMYEEFYLKSANNSYYLRGRGYQPEDLLRVASRVAGLNLEDFVKRYVYSVEALPYDEAFGYVGLRLTRSQAKHPINAGLALHFENPTASTIENVRINPPAEN